MSSPKAVNNNKQIDFLKLGKFECQKDIHFKTQPGLVAKNATPRLPTGN